MLRERFSIVSFTGAIVTRKTLPFLYWCVEILTIARVYPSVSQTSKKKKKITISPVNIGIKPIRADETTPLSIPVLGIE